MFDFIHDKKWRKEEDKSFPWASYQNRGAAKDIKADREYLEVYFGSNRDADKEKIMNGVLFDESNVEGKISVITINWIARTWENNYFSSLIQWGDDRISFKDEICFKFIKRHAKVCLHEILDGKTENYNE